MIEYFCSTFLSLIFNSNDCVMIVFGASVIAHVKTIRYTPAIGDFHSILPSLVIVIPSGDFTNAQAKPPL